MRAADPLDARAPRVSPPGRPTTDLRTCCRSTSAGRAEGSFDLGIQKALERLLVSSQFLFRIEREPANVAAGTPYRVSDLELASRLSFFLWSSIPDDELLDAAAAGRLKDPKVLEQQVRRMLADPRSESLVTNFAAQWLYLRDIDAEAARRDPVPRLRRDAARGDAARDGAVPRQRLPREPQRARPADAPTTRS